MSLNEVRPVISEASISNGHPQTPGGRSDFVKQMDGAKVFSNTALVARLLELMQVLDFDALSVSTPEELHDLVSSRYRQALAIEAESDARRGELYSYDRLTTDTQRGKSTEWFAETGKMFSLGVASYCIVVGLSHEDIGIAGSHRNPITVEDTIEALGMKLNLPRDLFVNYGVSRTKEERLQQTIQRAAQEAVEEFSLLSPNGIPAHGAKVFAYGLFAAQPNTIDTYDSIVEKTIKSHPIIKEKGVNLMFNSNIGTMGELVYAGKTHPQYNVPTFIPYCGNQNS